MSGATNATNETNATGEANAEADPIETRRALGERFAKDPAARTLALQLFDRFGDVVDVEPAQRFDGDYRGFIDLVPELPIHRHRRHLRWVALGAEALDDVYGALARKAPAASPTRYRWTGLTLRFFRSVDRTTPNGFASGDWHFAYNVAGSLLHSEVAVRELIVHELFHLNDRAHDDWSETALGELHGSIVAKCGTDLACLDRYSPGDTIVKGGTYYGFQPGNGPAEYAAELAIRHYREQRAMLRGEALRSPRFKCESPENARAWQLFVDEFFGGLDLVPSCSEPR